MKITVHKGPHFKLVEAKAYAYLAQLIIKKELKKKEEKKSG